MLGFGNKEHVNSWPINHDLETNLQPRSDVYLTDLK